MLSGSNMSLATLISQSTVSLANEHSERLVAMTLSSLEEVAMVVDLADLTLWQEIEAGTSN